MFHLRQKCVLGRDFDSLGFYYRQPSGAKSRPWKHSLIWKKNLRDFSFPIMERDILFFYVKSSICSPLSKRPPFEFHFFLWCHERRRLLRLFTFSTSWDDVGGFSRVYHSTQLGSICRSLYFLKAALILSCWRQSQSLIRFWKAEETRRWLTLTDYPKLVACPMKLSSVV